MESARSLSASITRQSRIGYASTFANAQAAPCNFSSFASHRCLRRVLFPELTP